MPNFAFMEDVNKQRRNFTSLSELEYGLWNTASVGFAYNWQSKWVGTIAITTKKTQILFLSNVLVAVASLDLKVTTRHCGPLEARVTRVYFMRETKRNENSLQTSEFWKPFITSIVRQQIINIAEDRMTFGVWPEIGHTLKSREDSVTISRFLLTRNRLIEIEIETGLLYLIFLISFMARRTCSPCIARISLSKSAAQCWREKCKIKMVPVLQSTSFIDTY